MLKGARIARLSLEAFAFGGMDELPVGVTTLLTLLSEVACEVTSLCIISVIVPFFVSITEKKGNRGSSFFIPLKLRQWLVLPPQFWWEGASGA